MRLTKEQKQLVKFAISEARAVVKNAETMSAVDVAWALYFVYDKVGNVYHQIRDAALDEKAAKETT